MFTRHNTISQFTLPITKECNLNCLGCDIKKTKSYSGPKIIKIIESGTFFEFFPKKKWVNLIGGEPLESESLKTICEYLKAENIKIRLWSNGELFNTNFRWLGDYIEQAIIYLPSATPELYQEVSGNNTLETVEKNIVWMKSIIHDVALNFPIKPYTVQYLPEAYDFAFKKRVPLIIHYSNQDIYTKETLNYIKRFRHIHNVHLFKTEEIPPTICQAYPYKAIESKKQWAISLFHFKINSLRKRYGL